MRTVLDSLHELEFDGCRYDGNELVADITELVVGLGGRIIQGSRRYTVRFPRPLAHAVTEEFPAAVAQLIQGGDTGFLRRIESTPLRAALGLDLEQFGDQHAYALITAHEVVVAYCLEEPVVQGI